MQKQQTSLQLPVSRQQGFVLILTLILLAVLTLIGVSSMNSASMELKATANARQHQVAFNVVQSVLEFAVSADGAALIDFQINDPLIVQTIDSSDFTVNNGSSYSARAVFAGCGVGVGSSLEKGFSFNFFDITGTGSNAKGTATSVQTQGIRFPAASC
jgi:Tfp pilus assembly protein PilX